MSEDWKAIEQRVFTFFKEHPIHAFKTPMIAKYLGITEKEAREAVLHLEAIDIVELRYQYATAELTELIDEPTGSKTPEE
jgi:hypothetical protein